MKRNLVWMCAVVGVFCARATAQGEPGRLEAPTFSEGQLEAAFDTCRALAEKSAETRRQFPMKYGLTEQPFIEQKACVLSVLRGDTGQMMPLG